MFEQSPGERVKMALGGGDLFQLRLFLVQNGKHQTAQRHVADVGLRHGPELLIHPLDVVARVLDKLQAIEALRFVFILHGADIHNIELRAVGLVLIVGAANFVEMSFLPILFARLKPGAVIPDHEGCEAQAISKPARVEWLAVASRCPRSLRQ